MSSADKTREALMNTMVKTKTGAKTDESPANKAAAPITAKPAANKKATTRKKAVAKKAPVKKAATRKSATKSAPQADPFQSKGRVWPD
jgi:DNA-binding protein HU-beta